ncbi:hypothetical protein HS125_00075 [bacterium]|nr:hypothetical protein [bacterium]
MISTRITRRLMDEDREHWLIHLMNFVDDFRYYKDMSALAEPYPRGDERMDAILASTAESLCDELGEEPPEWLLEAPPCRDPWFVSGVENFKAIALAESPLRFRVRTIFVMDDFLSRV